MRQRASSSHVERRLILYVIMFPIVGSIYLTEYYKIIMYFQAHYTLLCQSKKCPVREKAAWAGNVLPPCCLTFL